MGTRSSKVRKETLSDAELAALISSTKMSKSEILKWHRGFYKDCPSGRLAKPELIKIYQELFPIGRAKKFCDLVFNVFDKNNSNTIDFSEFIMACSLTSRGKPQENMKMSFDIYDAENNQLLDRYEIKKIVEAVYELYEGKEINEIESRKKVNLILDAYDKTESGSIPKTELIEALSLIQNDIKVAEYFNQRSLDQSSSGSGGGGGGESCGGGDNQFTTIMSRDDFKIAQFLNRHNSYSVLESKNS